MLDTPHEKAFDDLVALAARICGTPVSLVSLVDRDRQWFKANLGLEIRETPRAVAFCSHAIERPDQLMIVPDAARDPVFANNPLVTGEWGIRFYAGMPLRTPEGHAIGTLCVIDRQPRTLSAEQQEALGVLARQVMAQLELRRALAIIGEEKERYRLLFESNPSAMWVFDHANFAFLAVNDAMVELYGYTREELSRMTVLDLRPPEDVAEFLRQLQAHTLPFRAVGRLRHRKKDGTVFPVDIYAQQINFAGRKARLVLAVNMSEQERAVAALRASEARFRALSESAPLGIFECDAAGAVTYYNPAMAALTGRPVQACLGQGWAEAIHPADRAAARNGWERAGAEGRIWDQEQRVVRPDGSERWVHTLAAPSRDDQGRIIGYIGSVEDITDRRTAESALRASEERFKLVARAVSDVIWDWDLATDSLWWGDGMKTVFGFPPEEIEPGVASWSNRIHPDDRDRVVSGIRQAIDSGRDSWADEYRFLRKDRTYALVQDRGYILRDTAGKGIRMVGGMSDQTERKRLEAQFLRAQRMEGIGTLAGGIAHDLNNVLAPILMSIELLKLDLRGNPQHMKALESIEGSARRGADLVRQVLTFARGLDGQRVAVNLRHLLGDLQHIASETFPRNIAIRIAGGTPSDLWPIAGDPTQLHQVLLNLAVNARDAMPNGGVLTVAAENVTIDQQYAATSREAKAGPYVVLKVTDTGTGIAPEIRDRIFEPFFTTKEVGKGTGLGLSTVHAIVKSHGGFVSVYSEPGRGTTFKVYLPADPALRGGPPPAEVVELPRGRGVLGEWNPAGHPRPSPSSPRGRC